MLRKSQKKILLKRSQKVGVKIKKIKYYQQITLKEEII